MGGIIACFVAGLMLGGMTATAILCCLQIDRINRYEVEIERLRNETKGGR